jgi:hypothetical protein
MGAFRLAIAEFEKSMVELAAHLGSSAFDGGRAVGGIYGKAAAEALTTSNQNAEVYDPEALRDKPQVKKGLYQSLLNLWRRVWCFILDLAP